MTRVQDPVIPAVRQLIDAHPGTISLGQGVVHYSPPEVVLQELARLVGSSAALHRYGFVSGSYELRETIAQKLSRENEIQCEADHVVFTAGSNMAFLHAVLAIADVGDEIVLPSPYFFNHGMAIAIAGCKLVSVPCKSDYQLDLEAIEQAITSRTRAVVTVSPNNPTGAVYPEMDLKRVNALCKERGIYHVSDEAYEYFCFDGKHYSPACASGSADHTISLFTLSKAYALAGWRAGYMVVPGSLVPSIKKIQDTSLVSPPPITERLAQAALEAGQAWCRTQIEPLKALRDSVMQELRCLAPRCSIPAPQGAFYMLMKIDTDVPAMKLVERLIREHSVAVLPGDTFGCNTTAIRIAYAALPPHEIMEAVGRLKRGIQAILNE